MTDLPELLDLSRDISQAEDADGVVDFSPDAIQRLIAYQTLEPDRCGLILLVDDLRLEIVGFAAVQILNGCGGHIDQAYVYPAYRGDGTRTLYDFVETWCRTRKAPWISLVTRKTEKDGFLQYGFKPVHLLMMKEL